jgi:hypothetical protein
MTTTKKTLSYLIAIFALVVLGYSSNAFAMTITPVRYEIQGDPGQTVTKEMTIINEDNTSNTYYSSFANFEAQGETGSASFTVPKDDIGTWMTTESSVTLLPGEQRNVSFSIKIPQNAEPGGHFGVIFWGTSPETNTQGKQLAVSAKTGLLVLLSVSGNVKEGGGLLSYSTLNNQFWYNSLPVSFTYRFQNAGGDRVKPAGVIQIRDTLFLPTKKLDANPVNGNILPNSTRKFTIDWVKYTEPEDAPVINGAVNKFFHTVSYQWKNFAVGLYSANLNLSYGSTAQVVKKSVYFFVFPWQLLICLIVILLIVFFVGKKLIIRYNNYIIKMAHSTVKTPEDASHV